MKNLENYGVQNLNAKEIRETEGGQSIDELVEILGWAIDETLDYLSTIDWGEVFDEDPNMGIPISA